MQFHFLSETGLFGNLQTLDVISRINLGSAAHQGSFVLWVGSHQSGLLDSISQHVRLLDTFQNLDDDGDDDDDDQDDDQDDGDDDETTNRAY